MTTTPKRILVAEDNQVMSDVVQFNLERAGFDVTVKENGQEALDLLEEETFDLLITDFQMPEMEGDELCRELRKDDRHQNMKIIMCSAKGYELDVEKLKQELDIYELIYKPFSPIKMKETVTEIFNSPCVS